IGDPTRFRASSVLQGFCLDEDWQDRRSTGGFRDTRPADRPTGMEHCPSGSDPSRDQPAAGSRGTVTTFDDWKFLSRPVALRAWTWRRGPPINETRDLNSKRHDPLVIPGHHAAAVTGVSPQAG